jgi:predicted secreted protein
MTWLTTAALFFILWWMTFLISMPLALRPPRGDEATEPDAPRAGRVLFVLVLTTLLAAVLVAGLVIAVRVYGASLDIFPRMLPD